jgi:hypothetical protein
MKECRERRMKIDRPISGEARMILEGGRQAVDALEGASMVIGLIAAAMRTAPEERRGDEVPVWREALLFVADAIDARADIARGWLDYREEPQSAADAEAAL